MTYLYGSGPNKLLIHSHSQSQACRKWQIAENLFNVVFICNIV